MAHTTKLTTENMDTEVLDNADLGLRFEIATLKLRECALHAPGINSQEDAKIEALENKLLFIQEDILEQIAKNELKNDEDFKVAKKLWKSAIDLKHTVDVSVLDRLAVSLFNYTEQKS